MDSLEAACAGHRGIWLGNRCRHSEQHIFKKQNKTAGLGNTHTQQLYRHILAISTEHCNTLGGRWASADPPETGLIVHAPPQPRGSPRRGGVCEKLLFGSGELVQSSTGNLLSYASESSLHMSCFYKKKPRTDSKSSMSSLPG